MTTLSVTCTRALAAAGVVTLGLIAVVSAQTGTASSPPRGSMEELVAEIRGLRAELRQASDTSIRAQLLVARLQLQEQRITALERQLSDVQRQQAANDATRSMLTAQLAVFGKSKEEGAPSIAERKEFDFVLGPLKAQLKQMDKADAEFQAQQTYLTGLIAEEQSRWTTFNALLDELSKPIEDRTRR